MEKQGITLSATLQGLTLAVLGAGGWVGKGAYEDLREKLDSARLEATELRAVVKSLDQKVGGYESRQAGMLEAVDVQRSRVDALAERVTRLEALGHRRRRQ